MCTQLGNGILQTTPQPPQLFGSTGLPLTFVQALVLLQKTCCTPFTGKQQLLQLPPSQLTVAVIVVNGVPAHTSDVTPVAMFVSKL
jgi:hypothetical protein